ncbi:hypothetical protein HAX54_023779 [Datura stramonium]|uniref:Uncharacterized protein n=1 Tax=Datura stramonium TaxID=4076 RepID=A0ABS8UZE6_DATST|nr:hypothetical protein [Datura stramonium]
MSFREALASPALDLGGRCRKKESSKEPRFSFVKRKRFLKSCLVGSFVKWVGSPEAIRTWAAKDEDLAVKILNEGRRWFDNNFMHLERWKENVNCADPRKVGDLCGGFVNVICSLHYLSSVRILVRKGGKVPVLIVVEDGVAGYRVWLSIEFRPSILQEDRKGNIEPGRRRGGGFRGGRGRRVEVRDPARMKVVGEPAIAERKKSNKGFFELGKGRKTLDKEKDMLTLGLANRAGRID